MRLLLCFIVVILSISACKPKKNGAVLATDASDSTAQNISATEKIIDELQQLTPYTLDEMKSMLPVTIDDDSIATVSAQQNMGTSFARAVYALSDSSSVEINLFDCGGTAGSGIYSTQFINQLDNDSEYDKTIDFRNGRAIEHVEKNSNNATFTYLANGRILVIIEGRNTGIEKLKDIKLSKN